MADDRVSPVLVGGKNRQHVRYFWVFSRGARFLAHSTPDERKKIERETSDQKNRHKEVMRQGVEHDD